jgi:hypothetical protein
VPGLGALRCSSISCSSIRRIRRPGEKTQVYSVRQSPSCWDEEITACFWPRCSIRCTCSSTAALCEGSSPACSFQYSTYTQSGALSFNVVQGLLLVLLARIYSRLSQFRTACSRFTCCRSLMTSLLTSLRDTSFLMVRTRVAYCSAEAACSQAYDREAQTARCDSVPHPMGGKTYSSINIGTPAARSASRPGWSRWETR